MRWMPEDRGLEKNVLMMMMMNNDAAVLGVSDLVDEDFYWEHNLSAFKALSAVVREGRPIDPFSVTEKLTTLGLMPADSANDWAMDLSDPGATVFVRFEDAVDHLKRIALRRQAISSMRKVGVMAMDPQVATEEVVDTYQQTAQTLGMKQAKGGLISFEEGTPAAQAWIDDVMNGVITGLQTGMGRFDRFFGGLLGGDLLTIGARPSQGKTALALAIAIEAAKRGQLVAFFSMEMQRRELFLRAYCRERNLDIHSFRTGTASFAEKSFLAEAARSMKDLPLYIDDTRAQSPMKIKAAVRRLGFKRKPDLVIVDYLTMMKGDTRNKDKREELSYCARSMKDMAGELNIPFTLLSQLTRLSENEKREPRMSDMRETGEIEEASDTVALIHRPVTYAEPNADIDPRLAKILVPKFRNGPTGWFKMLFEARCAGFFDWVEPGFLDGIEFPNFVKITAGQG